MGRRPLVVMVLGWFAVVGAVGALTFVVVSNAGNGVGRASAAERVVVVSPESPTPSTSTSSQTPTLPGTPTPPSTPTPSVTPQTSRPPATPSLRPTTKGPRPTAPAVDPHTASFTTDGGIVVATCRESRIVLQSIRPRDGWGFQREYLRGALEVTFKAPDREVEIYLRCVDEVPTRLKPGSHWGGSDRVSSESPSSPLVKPTETVQAEVSQTPSPTAPSTQETPHG